MNTGKHFNHIVHLNDQYKAVFNFSMLVPGKKIKINKK